MNIMKRNDDYPLKYIKIEDAIRFLSVAFPVSDDPVKPVLLHSIRVGVMLLNHGHDLDVCIAGFLHDTVEDSQMTIEQIENQFGSEVKEIVFANTKDPSIEKDKRNEDLYKRCADYGIKACLVKAADIIDNINYFREIENNVLGELIMHKRDSFLSYLPDSFKDTLFRDLKNL